MWLLFAVYLSVFNEVAHRSSITFNQVASSNWVLVNVSTTANNDGEDDDENQDQ